MRGFFLFTILFALHIAVLAQPSGNTDTIFRANANAFNPKNNPFIKYAGKTIRHIYIRNVGFEGDVKDTTKVNGGFGVKLGNALHKNTRQKIIANNLLFKEGDKLNPYMLTDNERYLRDLDYIQDALIIVQPVTGDDDVDLLVLV